MYTFRFLLPTLLGLLILTNMERPVQAISVKKAAGVIAVGGLCVILGKMYLNKRQELKNELYILTLRKNEVRDGARSAANKFQSYQPIPEAIEDRNNMIAGFKKKYWMFFLPNF